MAHLGPELLHDFSYNLMPLFELEQLTRQS